MMMEEFLVYSHAASGGTVLLLGLVNFINRKGTASHKRIGKIYIGAMWWICLSAFLLIGLYRFNAFLTVIGVLTFYASFSGVRVLRRKRIGSEKWYDWAVAIVTVLFGIGLIGYALHLFLETANHILATLCIIFGSFTIANAAKDLWFFIRPSAKSNQWWLHHHVSAIGGSYIAAITAFAVQNPNLFMPNSANQWLLWIIPSLVGSPLLAIVNYRISRTASQPEPKASP